MMRMKMEGAALLAALVCMSAAVVSAESYSVDPKDVKYMDELLGSASKFPEAKQQIDDYMKKRYLDVNKLAERKFATPVNVQQYAAGTVEEMPEKTLESSHMEARRALEAAMAMVEAAKKNAKDEPRMFVAETGAQVMDILADIYNGVSVEVYRKISIVRSNAEAGTAIALVINGGGSSNPQQTAQSLEARTTAASVEEARIQQAQNDIDPGDALTGQLVYQIVLPELPLSKLGQRYMTTAKTEARTIRPIVKAMAKQLTEAEKLAEKMLRKESEYNKAMDGAGGNSSMVIKAAVESLGQHLAVVDASAERLNRFVNGRGGETMDLVVQCVEKVLAAAESLQRDVPDQQQLALAQAAFEANQRAAREASPTARELRGLLAMLGREARGDMVRPLGFREMAAPGSRNSGSGDAEGVKRAVKKDMHKVTATESQESMASEKK